MVTVMMISYKEREELFRRSLKAIWDSKPGQIILSTVSGDPCLKWIDKGVDTIVNNAPDIYCPVVYHLASNNFNCNRYDC